MIRSKQFDIMQSDKSISPVGFGLVMISAVISLLTIFTAILPGSDIAWQVVGILIALVGALIYLLKLVKRIEAEWARTLEAVREDVENSSAR